MINRKSTFFLGIFIFLIPFLGFPSSGKMALIILSGLTLIALSVTITLPKKYVKPVAKKPRSKKEKVVPMTVENIPENISPYPEAKENEHDKHIDQA